MKNLPKKGIENKKKQKGKEQKLGDLNVCGEFLYEWGHFTLALLRSV
jgi:hypothetical protein